MHHRIKLGPTVSRQRFGLLPGALFVLMSCGSEFVQREDVAENDGDNTDISVPEPAAGGHPFPLERQITGRVLLGGLGLSDLPIRFAAAGSQEAQEHTTNAEGQFTLLLSAGTFVVWPTHPDFHFRPRQRMIAAREGSLVLEFSVITHRLAGKMISPSLDVPFSDVEMVVTPPVISPVRPSSEGRYELNLPHGSYALHPRTKFKDMDFSPHGFNVLVGESEIEVPDFGVLYRPITLSGRVALLGQGARGVTVGVFREDGTIQDEILVDDDGNFSARVPRGRYDLRPSRDSFKFEPETRSAEIRVRSVSGLDFDVVTHRIVGTVLPEVIADTLGASEVVFTPSDVPAVPIQGGAYEAFLPDGGYVLTPRSLANPVDFSPQSQMLWVDAGGEGPPFSFSLPETKVENLRVVRVHGETVELDWEGEATRFQIYRRADALSPSPGDLIGESSDSEFVDTEGGVFSTNFYSVVAMQGTRAGPVSTSAMATTGLFDDFSGADLDPLRWRVVWKNWGGPDDCDHDRDGNKTEAYNGGVVPKNVFLDGAGNLILEAHGDNYQGSVDGVIGGTTPGFPSQARGNGRRVGGAIASRDYFASGTYEVNMKVAPVLGVSSSFFTFHFAASENGSHTNHEIDIEFPGRSSQNSATSNHCLFSPFNDISLSRVLFSTWTTETDFRSLHVDLDAPQDEGGFHKYRFEWHTGGPGQDREVDFYVDDVYFGTSTREIPTRTSRIWLAAWFPRRWAGTPSFDTEQMVVDWVRFTPYLEAGDEFIIEPGADVGWAP